MNSQNPNPAPSPEGTSRGSRWPWLLAIAGVLIVLIAIVLPRPNANSPATAGAPAKAPAPATGPNSTGRRSARAPHIRSPGQPAPTAAEIVASKVNQFGRNRREFIRAKARRLNQDVPAGVEKFFDAIEGGRWEEIKTRWEDLRKHSGQFEGTTHLPELDAYWPAVLDAYGVAEQAHLWPAQKLLDYGHAILDSLRPGMIYVGGTDPGRWIPELLNDTGDGEHHVIITQNAFADGRYLEFASELYGDRIASLTKEDSQRAFQDYMDDAQKRLRHDMEFPNEPKQVRPGEDIKFVDPNGQNQRVQVSGHLAVTAIRERLMQMLMQKNPDATFAMETSFPMASLYAGATTLGPIMELRNRDEQNTLTRERAAQSVDYWRATAQQLATDPTANDSEDVRKTYSKLASEQAALFQDRKYITEAEKGFQYAIEICPSSPEAVFRYVNLLAGQNRLADAVPVAQAAVKAAPENGQFRDLLDRLKEAKKN